MSQEEQIKSVKAMLEAFNKATRDDSGKMKVRIKLFVEPESDDPMTITQFYRHAPHQINMLLAFIGEMERSLAVYKESRAFLLNELAARDTLISEIRDSRTAEMSDLIVRNEELVKESQLLYKELGEAQSHNRAVEELIDKAIKAIAAINDVTNEHGCPACHGDGHNEECAMIALSHAINHVPSLAVEKKGEPGICIFHSGGPWVKIDDEPARLLLPVKSDYKEPK